MYIPSVLKFKIEFGLSFLSDNSATARFFVAVLSIYALVNNKYGQKCAMDYVKLRIFLRFEVV
jgi:hypothetical protein